MDLAGIAEKLDTELTLSRRPGITDENILDLQAICVAEEAGELLGAYRRCSGRARRAGTRQEVADEIADVLIVTAVFARRFGTDIDTAVQDKLRVIYARGWKEQA
jgi:NTP pyrophosphatase (non-canonical NTP hydrolase)